MTTYAAFLRGVNLGKRTIRSAELKAAFETMGFAGVKTLLASGNVLFEAAGEKDLKTRIETGLHAAFGFEVGTVLRSQVALKALVKSDPFDGRTEDANAKLYVMLLAEPLPDGLKLRGLANDYDLVLVAPREVFIVAHRKPDGTYGAGLLSLEKQLPRGLLVTTRNWNTVLKAAS